MLLVTDDGVVAGVVAAAVARKAAGVKMGFDAAGSVYDGTAGSAYCAAYTTADVGASDIAANFARMPWGGTLLAEFTFDIFTALTDGITAPDKNLPFNIATVALPLLLLLLSITVVRMDPFFCRVVTSTVPIPA